MKNNNYFRGAVVIAGIILLLSACSTTPTPPNPDPNPGISQELKNFSFATRGEVKLSINYNAPGFKTLIEVYDENPIVEGSNDKKTGLLPIYSAYTDSNGKLDGVMYIPSAVSEAYLYTNRWGLPLCVKLDVNPDALTMTYDATTQDVKSSREVTKALYEYVVGATSPYKLSGNADNLLALGRFDIGGFMTYRSAGEPTDYTANYIKNTKVINGESVADLSKRAQQYYEKYDGNRVDLLMSAEKTNIKVKKEGSLDFIFLADNAEYKNTIGYYYYEAGSAPKEADFKSMKKYVIIPYVEGRSTVNTGNTIRLQYFGKDGNSVASDKFPANTVVGWFIVSDGWNSTSGKIRRWDPSSRNFFFSNDQDKNMRFVSLVDSKTGSIVLGCEDQPEKKFDRNKEDYHDMLFFIKSDDGELDNEGKSDISEETPETPDGKFSVEGVVSFEDIWPSGGDYDMNDVALTYKRTINFDKDNNTTSIEENFEFIQKDGAASIDSYFAYQVENMGTVALPVGCEMDAATNSIVFANSTRVSSGEKFTVKRTFQGAVKVKDIANDFNPYIMIGSKDAKRKEVHLPSHPATTKADKSFIGTGNDAYYMDKNGYYPFAIDIPKVDFVLSREARSIDKTYPRFTTWATSFGKKDADWYNDAPKN